MADVILKLRTDSDTPLPKMRGTAKRLLNGRFPEQAYSNVFGDDLAMVEELRLEAEQRSDVELPAPASFLRLTTDDSMLDARLIDSFRTESAVEFAALTDHPIFFEEDGAAPDVRLAQRYQDPAPIGINVAAAHNENGGKGNHVSVCVCEYGFDRGHPDLPSSEIEIVFGRDRDLSVKQRHGTRTLGILFAKEDGTGVTGVCPDAKPLFSSESHGQRSHSIIAAIRALRPGDILVLVMQTGYDSSGEKLPAEANPAIHYLCRIATALGIVVVAAAGNGNRNLNRTPDGAGKLIWSRTAARVDSGAILVGSGAPAGDPRSFPVPRSRLAHSCYGNRVNCQGWGDRVVTTDADNTTTDTVERFTSMHFGTSSATAIVAGAVACLQSIHIEAFSSPLTPWRIRKLLSNASNGTAQQHLPGTEPEEHIGPLPDLRKLIAAIHAS